MYVTEIVERCSELAAGTARVYRRLADRFQAEPDRATLWRELAIAEEVQAAVLQRELESFREQDQSGSFLPEYGDRLQRLDAELRELERRAESAQSIDEALAIAVALEQADLEELYDDLVLQGEPAFRLISERLEGALANGPQGPASAGMARRGRPR